MTTGMHVVADIACARCLSVVGWKYVRHTRSLPAQLSHPDALGLMLGVCAESECLSGGGSSEITQLLPRRAVMTISLAGPADALCHTHSLLLLLDTHSLLLLLFSIRRLHMRSHKSTRRASLSWSACTSWRPAAAAAVAAAAACWWGSPPARRALRVRHSAPRHTRCILWGAIAAPASLNTFDNRAVGSALQCARSAAAPQPLSSSARTLLSDPSHHHPIDRRIWSPRVDAHAGLECVPLF